MKRSILSVAAGVVTITPIAILAGGRLRVPPAPMAAST
jgi:hypothetical protein